MLAGGPTSETMGAMEYAKFLQRCAERLNVKYGAEPSVVAYLSLPHTDVCVWSDGSRAEYHPGDKTWHPLPRADYAAIFAPSEAPTRDD